MVRDLGNDMVWLTETIEGSSAPVLGAKKD